MPLARRFRTDDDVLDDGIAGPAGGLRGAFGCGTRDNLISESEDDSEPEDRQMTSLDEAREKVRVAGGDTDISLFGSLAARGLNVKSTTCLFSFESSLTPATANGDSFGRCPALHRNRSGHPPLHPR